MKFKEGDFVRYNDSNGSTGKIESLNHYGGYYVRWVYGRNVANEIMYSSISSCTDQNLVGVSEEEYNKTRDEEYNKGLSS